MTLADIKSLLVAIGIPVYHHKAKGAKGNYIVWQEESEGGSGHADNKKTTEVMEGTIDYFTKDEYDPMVDKIKSALNGADMAYRLNSIQHEDDTGYTHYEWVWEVVSG
jgi:hypothetical protein